MIGPTLGHSEPNRPLPQSIGTQAGGNPIIGARRLPNADREAMRWTSQTLDKMVTEPLDLMAQAWRARTIASQLISSGSSEIAV